MKQQSVSVVGAGVVGLSTAIRTLEAGYDVTLFAEVFPTDTKSIKYTSFWAGAVCRPGLGDSLSARLEKETMRIFAQLVEEEPNVPIAKHSIVEYAQVATPEDKHDAEMKRLFPDFRVLDPSELPSDVAFGVTFSIFFIDVPHYLAYLLQRFLSLGGRTFRCKLSSLGDLLSPNSGVGLGLEPFAHGAPTTPTSPPSFDARAIVNCTGLGALFLTDVKDTAMYPTRGETVLLCAPWITSGLKHFWKNGDVTYIIPRGSGVVVLGGTFQPDDWHPSPRPEMVKLMKERGIAVCRELLPPSRRTNGGIDDLDVIEECVGLRPTREGGVRVETTWLDGTPVVHNYGHGGSGFEESWASADLVVKLLQTAVKS
ncbi:hypothetical protein C8R44DRAFT_895513 [Mycena epipterygia]|nr:hypothetical protein C8R44DRAFT_895513 [Mycena epipterygia]